jgi:hypothetical protein
MAPKTMNKWKEHEWWVEAENSLKPMLWITQHAILEGCHWATLSTSFGHILSIGTAPNDVLVFFVKTKNELMTKISCKGRS